MAPLRDLELMIQSHYPLIAIETSEEDFVDLPTAVERKEIFAVHLQKRKRGPAAFDLDRRALHGVLALGRAHHRHPPRRAAGDPAAVGHPQGGDRRPARVGPRARGDGELNRSAHREPASRHRVPHDVEQQLLELDDFGADASASFPPSVGIEYRVARGANRDFRRVALHGSMKHST